ncbi:MAG: CPBP family intramembrane metalloprotease [Roseburia sp.]|nr:CPBP family intramembrane metalloprotease [Roseburia sp.]
MEQLENATNQGNQGEVLQKEYPQSKEKPVSMGKRVGYCLLTLSLAVLCLVMQVLAMLVILIPALVLQIVNGSIDMSDSQAYMAAYMELAQSCSRWGILLYHIVGILLFGLWYRFSFKKPRPTIKGALHNTTGKALLLSVVCGVCLCIFANATVIVESHLVPSIVEAYMELAEAAGLGVDAITIVATILLAPIGEEFLCRGLMLKFAKKSFGRFWPANLLQAFLFGCIHGNWVQGIYAFFIGLVLGWLVERYHTLLPAILLHFVVNLSSSTWVPYLFDALFGDNMPALLIGLLMVVVPVAIIIGLLYWERPRKAVQQSSQVPQD